jgi:uncharacterized membrane protein
MNPKRKFQSIHVFFNLSIIAKGIDGALEIVGGLLLFFISPDRISAVIQVLTQHELSEDPRDLVATYLLNSTHSLTKGVTMFAAAYLLWHGMVKAGLVAALLLKRRWAYPAAIVAFFLFLVYQLYQYTHTHSPALLALSIVDMLVITLTWIEYKRLKAIRGFARSTE